MFSYWVVGKIGEVQMDVSKLISLSVGLLYSKFYTAPKFKSDSLSDYCGFKAIGRWWVYGKCCLTF